MNEKRIKMKILRTLINITQEDTSQRYDLRQRTNLSRNRFMSRTSLLDCKNSNIYK